MSALPIELRNHITGYLFMPAYDYTVLRDIYAWLCGVYMVDLVKMCKRLDITHTHTGKYLITSYHKTKINVKQRRRTIICNIMRWCVYNPVFTVIDMVYPLREVIDARIDRYRKMTLCSTCNLSICNVKNKCKCTHTYKIIF